MVQLPALLLCGLDCRPDLELDMKRAASRLRDSGAFKQLLIEPNLCKNHLRQLSGLKGEKILFGGCSVLAAADFYARAAHALSLEPGDTLAVDVMEEVLLRYAPGEGMEHNLVARLLAAARVLERAQSVPEEAPAPVRKALVYGSGFSGLQAALALAAAGVPADVLPPPSPMEPVSPGCLSFLLRIPRPAEALRARAEEDENIGFLAPGMEPRLRARAGGFELAGPGGLRREYGCVVFAPERVEEEPAEIGSLNLTRFYARLRAGKRLAGTCVLVFDQGHMTPPEVFRDGLEAARAVRNAGRARVWVLCRNVQVSLPGQEDLYTDCREAGVLFLKYRDRLGITNDGGEFIITGRDAQSGRLFSLDQPDTVMISRPARLSEAALRFAGLLNLRLFQDAWSQPDSVWRLARETSRPGVFACGVSLGSRDAPAVQRDALALARVVRQRLQPGKIVVPERIAVVDGEKCAFCLTCLRACPAGAVGRDSEQRSAVVDPGACLACGICAAVCPAQAIQLRNLGPEALGAGIEALA